MGKVLGSWIATTDELLSDSIDFTSKDISNLLNNMGLIEFRETFRIEDFERYVFLFGNDQEIYSSDERSFIEGVGSVYIYSDISRRTNRGTIATRIIVADLSGYQEAAKSCLFLMKIINKAIEEFNVFILKTAEGFFVGCRLYDKDEFKNCMLSSVIKTEQDLEEISQRLVYIPNTDEFIPYYTALVEAIEYKEVHMLDYDLKIKINRGINFSYLEMLSEVEKEYHISLERAREIYYESFEADLNKNIVDDYSTEMDFLRFIKSNRTNTLEMLFEAEEMALLANEMEQENEQILQIPDEINSRDSINDDMLKGHLNDTELMIKLLKEQKGL